MKSLPWMVLGVAVHGWLGVVAAGAAEATPAPAKAEEVTEVKVVTAELTPQQWLERNTDSINAALDEDRRDAIGRWAEEAKKRGLDLDAKVLADTLVKRPQAEQLAIKAEAFLADGNYDEARRTWLEAQKLWPTWKKAKLALEAIARAPVEKYLGHSDTALMAGRPLVALLYAYAAEAACPATETELAKRVAARLEEASAKVDVKKLETTISYTGDPKLPTLGTRLAGPLAKDFPRATLKEEGAKAEEEVPPLRLSATVRTLKVKTAPAGVVTRSFVYGQSTTPVPNPAYTAVQQRISSLERERDSIIAAYPRFRTWQPSVIITPGPMPGPLPGPDPMPDSVLRPDSSTVIFVPGQNYSDEWLANRVDTINKTLRKLYNRLQGTPTTIKEKNQQTYNYQAHRFVRTGEAVVSLRLAPAVGKPQVREISESRNRADETWTAYPQAGLAEKILTMPAEEEDLQALTNIAEVSTAAAVPELLRSCWDAQWTQSAAIADPDQRLEALTTLVLQCPGLSLRMDSLLRKEWKTIPPHLWKRLNEQLGQGAQP